MKAWARINPCPDPEWPDSPPRETHALGTVHGSFLVNIRAVVIASEYAGQPWRARILDLCGKCIASANVASAEAGKAWAMDALRQAGVVVTIGGVA